jgi:pimeloyl-ACP methyl ester carboxylesterase
VPHGEAYRPILPADGDLLAGRIPGERWVNVPDGSHGFNLEQRERFNQTVLDFLRSG